MKAFDAIVIGAGPAGLSAAAELAAAGRCLVLEQGPPAPARDRRSPDDLLSGVGGAGLFSDGKHSFFPSATALWQLPDRDALGAAFDATAALLRVHGVEATPPAATIDAIESGWREKRYPSLYVPFAERLACIDSLWNACEDRFPDARVVDAEAAGEI